MCCGCLILLRLFFHLGKVLKGPLMGTSELSYSAAIKLFSPLISLFLPGTNFVLFSLLILFRGRRYQLVIERPRKCQHPTMTISNGIFLLVEVSHDEAKMRKRRVSPFSHFLPRRERPLLAGKNGIWLQ